MSKYEIYPIPQDIAYKNGVLNLKVNFDFNLDENMDEINKNRIKEIFEKKSKLIKNNDQKNTLKIKINSNLEKFDEYILNISNDTIEIEAKDNDALYFALQTLEIIFDQSSSEVETLEINDYASVKYRGIIEGFYGVPWSWENKKELLKFGSKFKNNLFIYAPKDDPYHRDMWRELYPEKELAQLEELAILGNEKKNRFVYTISPFKVESNPITAENIDESCKILIEKFDQLYDAGIRQFGVLADDVGKLAHDVVVEVMNRLSNWKKTKKDLKDFLFCPGSYVLTWAWDAQELNAYTDGFAEDIHMFFTGRNTCTPVNKKDVEEFKTKEITEEFGGSGKVRRNPFFWLNWPVNDIDSDYRKLYMGKGELLETDVDNIVGLVTNPMQEANASKVAIFAVSDYAWNISKFDCDKSWEDSFKYIDRFAFDELKTIASHMTNQNEKGIQELEESPDFKELQLRLNDAMDNMLVSEVKDVAIEIKEKFEELVKTVDRYFSKSKEDKLIEEVKPYFIAFKELLLSGIFYIEAFAALEEGQKEIGLKLYDKASEYNEKYRFHPIIADPKSNRFIRLSETSKLRIGPMVDVLKTYLDKVFSSKRNISPIKKLFYRGLDGSRSYRIPALIKTDKDTLLAFADKRNEHQFDWGNIDLVVKRREFGQKEFSESLVIIDPVDQEGEEVPQDAIWPIDLDAGDKSAFVIDPVVVKDKDRIYVFITAFPESKGFFSIKGPGNGYIEIDGEKYLEINDKEDNKYILKDNKILTLDKKETSYTVSLVSENGNRTGDLFTSSGEKIGNIFLKDSKFTVVVTSHILMTYSDDDGKTWAKPVDLNPQIKEEWMMFMGVAPGRGLVLDNGRIVFPAYFNNEFNRQNSCVVYSDDKGKTWHRSKSVNDRRNVFGEIVDDRTEYNYFYQTGECQLVQLDNGDIKLFVRNSFHGKPTRLQIATSKDRGETFEPVLDDVDFKSQSSCQLSALHTHYKGQEYVLVTTPSSHGSVERFDGRVHVGKVDEKGNIEFTHSKYIAYGMYWYSSLEQIGDKFVVMYEGGETFKHMHMDIMYREFNWEYLMGGENKLRYEIYPKPQNIKYKNRSTYLNKPFKISSNENIEQNNIDSLKDILGELGYQTSSGENSINIDIKIDESLKNIDEYNLIVEEDNISIIGNSNDSVYYAFMTLKQILEQNTEFIRNLEINDYANQKIRGTIEGYYGVPYTTEVRKDLMEFSSKFKANAFVYAPKDDLYHREKWDLLYPEKELEDFKMLGELGEKIKTRFIWSISPFKKESNPISMENYESDMKKLIAKFEQIYSIGIRQFGVLGDDVGALPKDVVVKVMNDLSKWAKSKEDKIYDFIFVPEGYVLADWGFRPEELDLYSKEFPDNVHVIFTGDTTCAPITQKTVTEFKTREANLVSQRRDPLFWLNWPVNDIDRTTYRRIFMGKGEMLEPGVKGLVGTLTNPLEEGYASMPAIFAISDYAWNTNDFDAEKSWKDSFGYIEEYASEELYEISKHMSNADNGGIEGLEESEELKSIIEDFEKNIESDSIFEYRYPMLILKEGYQLIVDSIDKYYKNAKNTKLSNEIKPYVYNLRDKSLAAVELLNSYECFKNKNLESAEEYFENGIKLLQKSNNYTVNTKTAEFDAKELKAVSGTLRLDNNIEIIKNYLEKVLK